MRQIAAPANAARVMHYISTRGNASNRDFAGVTLAGLASDGGLYVPAQWPVLSTASIKALQGRSYEDAAHAVLHPFIGVL